MADNEPKLVGLAKRSCRFVCSDGWWLCWSVGERRALGLILDAICSYLLCIVPFAYHLSTFPIKRILAGVTNIPELSWPLALLSLVASPVPIMVLRVVCRSSGKGDTPGELMSGYAVVSGTSGFRGVFKQMAYGFLQYVLLFVVAFAGLILYLFLNCGIYILVFSFPQLFGLSQFVMFILVLRLLVGWLGWFLRPKEEGSLSAGADLLCRMKVLPRHDVQEIIAPFK